MLETQPKLFSIMCTRKACADAIPKASYLKQTYQWTSQEKNDKMYKVMVHGKKIPFPRFIFLTTFPYLHSNSKIVIKEMMDKDKASALSMLDTWKDKPPGEGEFSFYPPELEDNLNNQQENTVQHGLRSAFFPVPDNPNKRQKTVESILKDGQDAQTTQTCQNTDLPKAPDTGRLTTSPSNLLNVNSLHDMAYTPLANTRRCMSSPLSATSTTTEGSDANPESPSASVFGMDISLPNSGSTSPVVFSAVAKRPTLTLTKPPLPAVTGPSSPVETGPSLPSLLDTSPYKPGDPPDAPGVYVLKLNNGKYYVGMSERSVKKRIAEHVRFSSACSEFVKMHSNADPNNIQYCVPLSRRNPDLPGWEQTETLIAMTHFGIDNVRGFTWARDTLDINNYISLREQFAGRFNFCYKCGCEGHFIKRCTNTRKARWKEILDDKIDALKQKEYEDKMASEKSGNELRIHANPAFTQPQVD